VETRGGGAELSAISDFDKRSQLSQLHKPKLPARQSSSSGSRSRGGEPLTSLGQ
jgi:hypothetical protein